MGSILCRLLDYYSRLLYDYTIHKLFYDCHIFRSSRCFIIYLRYITDTFHASYINYLGTLTLQITAVSSAANTISNHENIRGAPNRILKSLSSSSICSLWKIYKEKYSLNCFYYYWFCVYCCWIFSYNSTGNRNILRFI